MHTAQLIDRASAEAARIVNDAQREAERIRFEAHILLDEARAERNEAAHLRSLAESELDAADKMVAATLGEAQGTLDGAHVEAETILDGARSRAWLEAHMIIASARSQARLLNEESEIFSWES